MTSDKINEPTFRSWIKNKNIKTAAILTDIKSKVSQAYGKGVAPALLKKFGVQIVETVDFVTEDVDFSAQITKVKAANPDGIVLAGEYHLAANIAREARKQGLTQPFIGDVPITNELFCKLGGDAVNGVYAVTDFWMGNPAPKVQDFIKKFKKEHKGKVLPHTTTAAMYDTLYITRDIIGKAGLSGSEKALQSDREKIRGGWASVKDYPGIAKTTIDANGDAWKDYYTLVVKNGEWVRVNN